MRRSLPVVVLGSLCLASIAQATTYVRVEKDGTKTYSDRPIPGGQSIDVKPAQGYSAPASSASSSRPPEQESTPPLVDLSADVSVGPDGLAVGLGLGLGGVTVVPDTTVGVPLPPLG